MATSKPFPVPFKPAPLPILDGGAGAWTSQQMDAVAASMASVQLMLPQAATAAPHRLVDGMVRLSRAPWRPVASQTADAWVYWDAAGSAWRYLSTAPTNT